MSQSTAVAPPGFCNRGEVRYGSIGGLEYEVPRSRLYCLCINVALCSTALQCIRRVLRRSSMTMKAHTYYIIFGHPPIWGSFPPPLTAPLVHCKGQSCSATVTKQLATPCQLHRHFYTHIQHTDVACSLSMWSSIDSDLLVQRTTACH